MYKLHRLYIIVTIVSFALLGIVLDTLPRSTKSELEKRTLAKFPQYSFDRLLKGAFTKEISVWFSDSEPFRDVFMALSMKIVEYEGMRSASDNVSFIAPDEDEQEDTRTDEEKNRTIEEYENRVTADSDAKIAHSGILIAGTGADVRALMTFTYKDGATEAFADMVNTYHKALGDCAQLYCMIIPTAIEYYCPNKAKDATKPQQPFISDCYSRLDDGVKAVNVYNSLGEHANENIYLRTDHHWSPLGGHYAAQKFAEVAKASFKPLNTYLKKTLHGYVGSMYGYSRDASLKEAPEDFEFYVPMDVEFSTTYTKYKLNIQEVVGEERNVAGDFFFDYPDGSSNMYCTFMGGDAKITVVKTSTKNNRKLAIIKDSFGNTLPSNLFYSFEEIHVLDYRYFTQNLVKYVKSNGITDFLIALNIFNACNSHVSKNCKKLLTQEEKIFKEKKD